MLPNIVRLSPTAYGDHYVEIAVPSSVFLPGDIYFSMYVSNGKARSVMVHTANFALRCEQ